MSKKYILVPYDMYKGLMSSGAEESFLDDTKRKMARLLTDESMDASTRSALYNQQLFNLLREKRAAESKPIRVEVTNPLTQSKGHILTAPGAQVGLMHTPGGETEPINVTPIAARQLRESVDDDFMSVASSPETTPTKTWDLRPKKPQDEEILNEFVSHVMENKKKYGVNEKGQILDKNKEPIEKSSVWQVAQRLLDQQRFQNLDPHTPPGTRVLKTRLTKDAEVSRILKGGFSSGQSVDPFVPEKWTKKK